MGVFRQLGDPVCPACLCEHHGAAYAEFETIEHPITVNFVYESFANGATILTVPITITETCCVIVNAAMVALPTAIASDFEIERPKGTPRTTQEDQILIGEPLLLHHASWEVLPPGVYTYELVNRAGDFRYIAGAWIKAVASDCEG